MSIDPLDEIVRRDPSLAPAIAAARQRARERCVDIGPPSALRSHPTTPRRLFIATPAWKVIQEAVFAERASGHETGGALSGWIGDNAVHVTAASVYVDEITVRGIGSLTSSLRELADTPDLIGSWHSHGYVGDAAQSRCDIEVEARTVTDLELDSYVSLIVAARSHFDAYTNHLEHTAWLYLRDRAGITYETLAG